jgi:peptide/nickel transport system substrate-binding protein
LMAAATVVLTGCGGGSSSGGGGASGAVSEAEVPSTVKVVVGAEFGSLEPNIVVGEYEFMVMGLYAGTLTKYQSGKQGEPELAEKFVPNKDFTEWTATLKPGLKFSDGTPLTANDVKATFDRIIEGEGVPFLGSPNLTSVTVKDPRTVVFKFKSPEAGFSSVVSQADFGIWPAAGLKQGESFWKHPISAGPYAIETFGPRQVKMSLNPNYPSPGPRPKAVEFNVVEDPGTRLAQVKTGQANWAFDLPANLIPQMTGSVEKQLQAVPGVYQLLMNNTTKPFDDARVRRAISYALDREAIVEAAFAGEVRPTSRYWPAIFPERAKAEESLQETTANVEAAKRELKGTECENGCTVNLVGFAPFPWTQPTMLLIQQQLEAIGIQVNTQARDFATVIELEENAEFEMILSFFLSPAPVEEGLARANLKPGPPLFASHTRFESKSTSELIEKLAATPTDQREQVGLEVGEVLAGEMPWAALADTTFINASNLPESVIRGELFELKIE